MQTTQTKHTIHKKHNTKQHTTNHNTNTHNTKTHNTKNTQYLKKTHTIQKTPY